jgi:hypothetical protein
VQSKLLKTKIRGRIVRLSWRAGKATSSQCNCLKRALIYTQLIAVYYSIVWRIKDLLLPCGSDCSSSRVKADGQGSSHNLILKLYPLYLSNCSIMMSFTTFHYFLKLPTEPCLNIWSYVLPSPRIVEIEWCEERTLSLSNSGNTKKLNKETSFQQTVTPRGRRGPAVLTLMKHRLLISPHLSILSQNLT